MSLHWRSENNTVSDVNGTKIFTYGKNVKAIALLRLSFLKCPPSLPSSVIPKECPWGTQDLGCRQYRVCC